MNITTKRPARRTALVLTVAALAFFVAPLSTARAQEHGPPSPEEVQEKIRAIEKLMKQAEEALARSTSSRETAQEAARRLEELLEEKAQEQTGSSADELRKQAKSGSAEAAEALRRLTEEARSDAAKASSEMTRMLEEGGGSTRKATEGVRKLLEKTKKSGEQAGEGIEWLLKNAVSSGGRNSGSGKPDKPSDEEGGEKPKDGDQGKKPEDGEKKPENPSEVAKPPESDLDPPREDAKVERWKAELPPQVRRAYESRDWDAIPPKWRSLLRAWTKKMADDLEKGRR